MWTLLETAFQFILVGHFCEYIESEEAGRIRETCGSFDEYLSAVIVVGVQCDLGVPGTFSWIPDDATPEVVYYQASVMEIS